MRQRIPFKLEWWEGLCDFPIFQHRYLRGVFLASILEPLDRTRQKRVLSAVFSELARRISRTNNHDVALRRVGNQLSEYCLKHSTSSRAAGSEIAYRRKLTVNWREPASRMHREPTKAAKTLSSSGPSQSSGRRQNHLMEVKTVAALIDAMKSGKASGNRGRATMEGARDFILNTESFVKIGTLYTNEFDIKEAWKRKGSVAHLCGALISILKEPNLTSDSYTLWAEEMNDFLLRAFEYQEYLSCRDNFAPQSRITTKLQLLPEELRSLVCNQLLQSKPPHDSSSQNAP